LFPIGGRVSVVDHKGEVLAHGIVGDTQVNPATLANNLSQKLKDQVLPGEVLTLHHHHLCIIIFTFIFTHTFTARLQ